MKKAAHTRNYILQNAFNLIYKNGFQATSIDNILDNTKVTKGAFYYHFKSKEEMGMAVIQDIVYPEIQKTLINPLEEYNNPLNAIFQSIKTNLVNLSDKQVQFGCPATNLIMELPPISNSYKQALQTIVDKWQNALVDNLQQAIDKQILTTENNLSQIANFIIASYQGTRTLGKLSTSKDYFNSYLHQLEKYIQSL